MPNPDYRKLFQDLEPHQPDRASLDKLATIMSGKAKYEPEEEMAFLNEKESSEKKLRMEIPKIPAGYTYFSQFMSHDISFDEANDRFRKVDFPWDVIAPEALEKLRNLRTPFFNLETVYGCRRPINDGEISRSELMLPTNNTIKLPLLWLGVTKSADRGTARRSYPCDLLRKNASVEAKIVDSRNDENLLLAQTQVAFAKFHNALVVKLSKDREYTPEKLFIKARKLAIRYYQKIILTDFLPRIVPEETLREVINKMELGKLFYQPERDDMYIPLEFSTAAFRFAHSMIRNKYNLNKNNPRASIDQLMRLTGRGEMGAFSRDDANLSLPSSWLLNWKLFYQFEDSDVNSENPKFNFADEINTELALLLLSLRPKPQHRTGGRAGSLAALDLYRGRRFGLPSGQALSGRMLGRTSISSEEIRSLIMNKRMDDVSECQAESTKKQLAEAFGEDTPLWFYILAEAEIQSKKELESGALRNAGKLGPLGGRIVAETILWILYNSDYSILQFEEWDEDEDFLLKDGETFDMPAMLTFVQQTCDEHCAELYPMERYGPVKGKFDELNPLEKGYQ